MKKWLFIMFSVLWMTGCLGEEKTLSLPPSQVEKVKETSGTSNEIKDENVQHYELRLNGETYKASIASDSNKGHGGFTASLSNGTKSFELKVEDFGVLPLTINQLSGAKGEKNMMISAPSGGSDGQVNGAVIKLNKNKDAIELERDIFSELNNTSFYDLDNKVKDKILHDWIVNKNMGFHTAYFDSFDWVKDHYGTVRFRLGYHPTLLTGLAKVHFDFNTLKFQLDEISDVSFEDIKAGSWCENVIEEEDFIYGKVLAIKNKQGNKQSILSGGDVRNLVACGESLDRPLASGKFYLIEAIADYNKSQKNNLLEKLLTYKLKTDIKDDNGNFAYTVALVRGITDEKILDRLRQGLSKSDVIKAERTVKLLINGDGLSIDQIDQIIHDGSNSVPINSNIATYTSGLVYDNKANTWAGTVLGQAIIAKDVKKVKWLLNHGADPNMPMGDYEFRVSPLKYAISLQEGDLTIPEELLKHGANGDELVFTMPGQASLNAYFKETPEITDLLSRYGFNRWYLEDPENNLKLTTKAEILNLKSH